MLDSDSAEFGGHDRLEPARKILFPLIREKWQNRDNYIQLYIPNRTAIVLCAVENFQKYGIPSNILPVVISDDSLKEEKRDK